ncbi:hypothetical protein OG921_17625 [Aldersonia sp. NBC_00410]|uniref:hypothetical protein n=1 Tax=Aldersonia sp. NBC_00410 TaxID=2975954 RepID=UPI0022561891|nr:hypothetical protein [Aldersonia sp. NBC_00410]MCX5044991.1 hypothetical protein [Aldersonia sp. NBC_00410]
MTARRTIATAIAANPGLGKLSTIRFAGQFGDGLFQAALSGAILFNPERETDPFAIAAGFAVLLLPYSMLGPFAGALLDRWDRRAVLFWANLVRLVLIVGTAIWLFTGGGSGVLLVLALAVVGVSRFVLAGVSAALPHVVPLGWLVPTNSVFATTATAFAALGAGVSVLLLALLGTDDSAAAVAVLCSTVGSVVGAVAAKRFPARSLGAGNADERATVRGALRAVAGGLRGGVGAVWRTPGVTTPMIGILAHRMVFGVDTLLMVLVLRSTANVTGGGVTTGLTGFGAAIAAAGVGMLGAAVLVPLVLPRSGRTSLVRMALAGATVVQILLVARLSEPALLAGALLLGLAGQTIKLTGDAAMQLDIADEQRGQVFALQDTIFNVAFVAALAGAALVVPDDGRARGVALAAAGFYLAALVAIPLNARRSTPG